MPPQRAHRGRLALGTIAGGEDATAAYEAVADRAVQNRPHPTEY
ncbi:hypothetical protein [Streptomyces sp. NPDC057238]